MPPVINEAGGLSRKNKYVCAGIFLLREGLIAVPKARNPVLKIIQEEILSVTW
ncbi:hypothetical protein [Neobacillus drentensis]|uniref:hypothetical protein n=1 Tax=Neobacillus drentensis TaxID=220684 RepID=UPI002FFFFDFA